MRFGKREGGEKVSSPEMRRMIVDGATGTFKAKKVTEFFNPGDIFEFHGQLYRVREEKVVHCSLEETSKAKMQILEEKVVAGRT